MTDSELAKKDAHLQNESRCQSLLSAANSQSNEVGVDMMADHSFIAYDYEISIVMERGRATVWRSVPLRPHPTGHEWHAPWHRGSGVWCFTAGFGRAGMGQNVVCPLGQPGDRLVWSNAPDIITVNHTIHCSFCDHIWQWGVEVERIDSNG